MFDTPDIIFHKFSISNIQIYISITSTPVKHKIFWYKNTIKHVTKLVILFLVVVSPLTVTLWKILVIAGIYVNIILIPTGINNYIHCKVQDEIMYTFPNRWSFAMDKQVRPPFYWACDYFSMLGFTFIRINKKGPWPSTSMLSIM